MRSVVTALGKAARAGNLDAALLCELCGAGESAEFCDLTELGKLCHYRNVA